MTWRLIDNMIVDINRIPRGILKPRIHSIWYYKTVYGACFSDCGEEGPGIFWFKLKTIGENNWNFKDRNQQRCFETLTSDKPFGIKFRFYDNKDNFMMEM